jgi:hypothetical protein
MQTTLRRLEKLLLGLERDELQAEFAGLFSESEFCAFTIAHFLGREDAFVIVVPGSQQVGAAQYCPSQTGSDNN